MGEAGTCFTVQANLPETNLDKSAVDDENYLDEEPKTTERAPPATKKRRSFSKMRRELNEEELSTPAVQKLLLDDIERLESENSSLSKYRDKYYQAKEAAAILEEKGKNNTAIETMFGVCLTVGAAALGFVPSLWSSQPHGWVIAILGAALIIGGIASKVVKR